MVRSLEHHADGASHADRVNVARVEVGTVEQHLALDAPRPANSCIRFSERSRVDLPQPDGPMNAVTDLGSMFMLTSSTARNLP